MLSSGQINRTAVLDRQTSHATATLEQVLRGLETMRKCRLNMGGSIASQTFTLEDILFLLETSWGHKIQIPHNLNGTIAVQAQKRNIITHNGYGRAVRDSANYREVREYSWSNHDNIQAVRIQK